MMIVLCRILTSCFHSIIFGLYLFHYQPGYRNLIGSVYFSINHLKALLTQCWQNENCFKNTLLREVDSLATSEVMKMNITKEVAAARWPLSLLRKS